jgi:predicted membrane protein
MKQPILPKRKAEILSNGLFLIALGFLLYTNAWWPGILLAIWLWVGLKQYLSGRLYDLIISTTILIGLFLITFFNINWSVLMPVLFVVGGIYIIFREFFYADGPEGEDKADEIKDDIDEGKFQ